MRRIFAIEWAQFRRGITIGPPKRGRKGAARDLATAWLRAHDLLERKCGGNHGSMARVRRAVANGLPVTL